MKVIVVPKKGAVRGILSRPITASTRVDLTDMQIKRCINAGAAVFVENTDGTKVPYSENSTNGDLAEAKRDATLYYNVIIDGKKENFNYPKPRKKKE